MLLQSLLIYCWVVKRRDVEPLAFQLISYKSGKVSPNAPKSRRLGGIYRFGQGFFGRSWRIANLNIVLKQAKPWFEVKILLESLFDLADACP